ncbi:MAG: relaxase/mobilization nuclease domain-containing protein [Verrucomicrobiota bacterium]
MIPKLHAKGKSFKGAALYLLHDKNNATSSDRVAWVQTCNFAVDDPRMAWKIMVATSYSQDRLKAEAGIKNTGRKSKDHVLHLSLSWHPDEADGLTRDEMMKAAAGALKALGANGHQALVICHTDERQPHVHILVNRVSPEDGRMLSSSKEKEKLSRWAQAYEESRGKIFCDERVLNNAARDRGEFTCGAKDTPRHILELEKEARQRVSPKAADKLSKQHREKDSELATRIRGIEKRHEAEWIDLYAGHNEAKKATRAATGKMFAEEIKSIREDLRPNWRTLHNKHRDELKAFDKREQNLSGRFENAFRGLNLKEMMLGQAPKGAVKTLFDIFASSGARLAALQRIQKAEKDKLTKAQKQKERKAKLEAKKQLELKLNLERMQFFSKRSDLMLSQSMDKAFVRTSWRKRHEDRKSSWTKLMRAEELSNEFNRASAPDLDWSKKDDKSTLLEHVKFLADKFNRSQQSMGIDRDYDRGR